MSIIVNNLSKTYSDQKAVDSISFEVKKGEILGFLGPNGAGKSTLLKCLVGLLNPSLGSVLIDGDDLTQIGNLENARTFLADVGFDLCG